MTHPPECNYTPEYFVSEDNILWRGEPCICDALRACEKRIREATIPSDWHEKRVAWVRANALDEAEAAVWNVRDELGYSNYEWAKQVVAAIRGLREEKR